MRQAVHVTRVVSFVAICVFLSLVAIHRSGGGWAIAIQNNSELLNLTVDVRGQKEQAAKDAGENLTQVESDAEEQRPIVSFNVSESRRPVSVYKCIEFLHGTPGSKPSFFVAGVHKGGSTAVFAYLILHPLIRPPACKETHFFSDDRRFHKGINYYLRHFDSLGANEITGEGSPDYIRDPVATLRVGEFAPDARIVVSLRDPTERFVSHYVGFIERGLLRDRITCSAFWERELAQLDACARGYLPSRHERLVTTFNISELAALRLASSQDATSAMQLRSMRSTHFAPCSGAGKSDCSMRYCFSLHPDNAISRSIYSDQLVRWLRFFPPSQIHLVQSERVFNDTHSTMQQIVRFLGLPDFSSQVTDSFASVEVGSHHHSNPLSNSCDRHAMHNFFKGENALLRELVRAQWPSAAQAWTSWPTD